MTISEMYAAMNGSYEEAKSRLMNDRLIEKFTLKFLSDPTMNMLIEAMNAGNIQESFRAAHTLKGVAANLAFTPLFKAADALTEQLRPCTEPADPDLFSVVHEAYMLTVDTIKTYESQKS